MPSYPTRRATGAKAELTSALLPRIVVSSVLSVCRPFRRPTHLRQWTEHVVPIRQYYEEAFTEERWDVSRITRLRPVGSLESGCGVIFPDPRALSRPCGAIIRPTRRDDCNP